MATIVAHGDRLNVLATCAAPPVEIEREFGAFRTAAESVDILDEAERRWNATYAVHLAYATGAWDAAEAGATALLAPGLAYMTPAGREWQLWIRGSQRIQRGRLDAGEEDLLTALTLLGDAYPESVAGGRIRLAMAQLARGRPDQGLTLVQEAAAAADATDYVLLRCHVDAMVLRAAADLAELGRARRDASAVARAEEVGAVRLARVHEALAGTLVQGMGVGRVVRTLGTWGLAEATRLAGTSDPVAWADAASLLDTWNEPGLPPYARYRQAEAYLARGEREPAAAALRAAQARAVELGASPLVADIVFLARRGRIDLVGTERPPSAATAIPPADPYRLSPRECEVLELLVEGRTNRQIGAALFISEKTASVHVTHILNKLGVDGRVAAAGVAVRAGLVPVEPLRR
jgi:DNA-binding CsgD family transcriptional regulator